LIYVNASVSRLPMNWIDGLGEGGRLLVPMSSRECFKPFLSSAQPDPVKLTQAMAHSCVFLITRNGNAFKARWVGPAVFIPAQGSGDEASEAALSAAFETGNARKVTRLIRGEEVPAEQRWLSGEGWCLAYDSPVGA
jgi:protein-L-isoaspartate(D-aspartate) O-methyltransferase